MSQLCDFPSSSLPSETIVTVPVYLGSERYILSSFQCTKCRSKFFVWLNMFLLLTLLRWGGWINSADLWSTWKGDTFHSSTYLTLRSEENWDLASRVRSECFEIVWEVAKVWFLFILYIFLVSSDDELTE